MGAMGAFSKKHYHKPFSKYLQETFVSVFLLIFFLSDEYVGICSPTFRGLMGGITQAFLQS